MRLRDRRLTIDVVYSESCAHVADAEREIERAIHRSGVLDADVRLHAVRSRGEAEERGLRGSPTVLVNGREVAGRVATEDAGDRDSTGPEPLNLDACREYAGERGLVLPYPPWTLVLRAIEDSGGHAGEAPVERQRGNL